MVERRTRDRRGGEFDSRLLRCRIWPRASHWRTPASVTKQYNLVLVEIRWCSEAGKVTLGRTAHASHRLCHLYNMLLKLLRTGDEHPTPVVLVDGGTHWLVWLFNDVFCPLNIVNEKWFFYSEEFFSNTFVQMTRCRPTRHRRRRPFVLWWRRWFSFWVDLRIRNGRTCETRRSRWARRTSQTGRKTARTLCELLDVVDCRRTTDRSLGHHEPCPSVCGPVLNRNLTMVWACVSAQVQGVTVCAVSSLCPVSFSWLATLPL